MANVLPATDFASRSLRLETLIRLRWLAVAGQTGAVTINNEHSSDWDADFGEVTKLWSTDNAELMMEAELDPDHYRTKTLIKALNKGKKLGLSIGGSVKDAALEFVEELGRKVLDEVQPDVVHIQSHIVIGRGLTRIAHQRGIPVIATNHVMAENILDHTTMPDFLNRPILKLAWDDAKRTFDMTRAVTTPTRKAADFLEHTIDIKGVVPISCGIDRRNYTPVIGPREQNRILFVGRLTGEKKVDVVLHALAKLDPALDVHFDIAGGGDQRKALEALTAQLGLTDRVTFHGRVTDEQLRELYSRATVFAIASIAELQSIVTMEAMASALPVVGANAVALPHLVHDGENGYLFEPGDVDDLAEKLTRVLTADAAEYERMQKASLDGVAVHDINRTLDTFEALYRGEPLPA